MRIAIVVGALLGALVLPARASAQEAEALRKELEQMRRQFEGVREEYQKAIDALSERIQRLEAKPQTVSTQPAAVAQVPPPSQPTIGDLLRPREPFSLTPRTGRGQLLFDIGVAGDFIGNVANRSVERAARGTFRGRENRFFPREIELSLFGQIDPYARGEVRLEAGEEFEDGERAIDVGLAEAHVTLLALPFGFQSKFGLMRNRFGLLNQVHQHDLPQPDRPNVLVNFFGEEQLVESGVEVSWVPPLPFYLEALAGVFNGDNDVAFGRGRLRDPLVTGRLRTFFELGSLGAIQLGVSAATGETEERLRNTIFGVDGKYKLWPEGSRHPILTLGGEWLFGHRRVATEREIEIPVDTDGDGIVDGTTLVTATGRSTRDRTGFYVYGEVQPWRQWLGGLRYDWSEFPADRGREWALEPYVAWMPSEFLRFRLAYKRTDRNRDARMSLGVDTRIAHEVLLQATFFLGAHPSHPF